MLRRPRLHFLHSVGKGPPGCPRITWFKTVQRNLKSHNRTLSGECRHSNWGAGDGVMLYTACSFFCFTALFKYVYFDFQIQQDLKHHHLTLPEAADLAQNRPLWRMMSTYGATQSWVACQKRRRRFRFCIIIIIIILFFAQIQNWTTIIHWEYRSAYMLRYNFSSGVGRV